MVDRPHVGDASRVPGPVALEPVNMILFLALCLLTHPHHWLVISGTFSKAFRLLPVACWQDTPLLPACGWRVLAPLAGPPLTTSLETSYSPFSQAHSLSPLTFPGAVSLCLGHSNTLLFSLHSAHSQPGLAYKGTGR